MLFLSPVRMSGAAPPSASFGSICDAMGESTASSPHNSDDEDIDSIFTGYSTALPSEVPPSYKDRRREAHTQAEQKRRDSIKKGYEELQGLVCPNANIDLMHAKLSRATVLQKTITQIEKLSRQKHQQESELERLRKEVMALKIMKINYEHIVKANQSVSVQGAPSIPDEVKYQVFQQMMDQLFQSFNSSTATGSFAELSACVIKWLEEHCKPQNLHQHAVKSLQTVLTNYHQQQQQQQKQGLQQQLHGHM